jgi:hypothetical protein
MDEVRRAVAARATTLSLPTSPAARPAPARLRPVEKLLLGRLVVGEVDRSAVEGLEDDDLADLVSAPILRAARALCRNGTPVTAASLGAAVPDEGSRRIVNEVAVEGSPAGAQSAAECVREIKRLALERRLEAIQARLRGAAALGEPTETLLQEKLDLKRRIASL